MRELKFDCLQLKLDRCLKQLAEVFGRITCLAGNRPEYERIKVLIAVDWDGDMEGSNALCFCQVNVAAFLPPY
jgi:hypothetical protein